LTCAVTAEVSYLLLADLCGSKVVEKLNPVHIAVL
jgi:hypothetical protein